MVANAFKANDYSEIKSKIISSDIIKGDIQEALETMKSEDEAFSYICERFKDEFFDQPDN